MAGKTGTWMTAPVRQAAGVPEPALRPREAYFPNRYVTRGARVYVDRAAARTAIVIRDPRGRERRIPAGAGGATRLVLEPRTLARLEFLGSLCLVGDTGEVLARLVLDDWQPETVLDNSVHHGRLTDAELDVDAFVAATGLPVTDNRRATRGDGGQGPAGHPDAAGRAQRDRDPGPAAGEQPRAINFWMALPLWFLAARVLLVTVFVGVVIFIAVKASVGSAEAEQGFSATGTYHVLALASAAAALALPPLAGLLIARAWWLDRASGWLVRDPAATLAPHPAGPVTRRFLRTASVRLLPADLVATTEEGVERWLPRSGPTAVTELARVTVNGRPERLELRTADGRPRAALPWGDWFAGAGGEQALAGFAATAALSLCELAGQHIPDDGDTIWPYQAQRLSSGRRAARHRAWPGLPGAASVGLPVICGGFSALFGIGSPPAFGMGVAAVVISAGPWYVRRLYRRGLDRAVQPEEAR